MHDGELPVVRNTNINRCCILVGTPDTGIGVRSRPINLQSRGSELVFFRDEHANPNGMDVVLGLDIFYKKVYWLASAKVEGSHNC